MYKYCVTVWVFISLFSFFRIFCFDFFQVFNVVPIQQNREGTLHTAALSENVANIWQKMTIFTILYLKKMTVTFLRVKMKRLWLYTILKSMEKLTYKQPKRGNFLRKIIVWNLSWFQVKILPLSVWFQVKLLKLDKFGANVNSWHRSEVKRDSMKWLKIFSSVNFPWTWIHWLITSTHECL